MRIVADSSARRRPSNDYARMFSALTFGAVLVVTGSIGLDLRNTHGFFEGTRWVDHPIWWQFALGIGFLLLGTYWARALRRTLEP